MIAELLEHLLTPWAMYVLWASVMVMALVVTYRTRLVFVALISAGALPWAVFYLWTALDLWRTQAEAVAYSRFAGAAMTISLLMALVLLCRASCGAWKR